MPEGVSPGESQAASPLWDSRFIGSRSASEVLARELIGARVTDASGNEFAEVADLIVDPEGRITGLVLSIGGFLGIGDKRVAVPWSDVSYGGRGRPLRARAAAAQLQAAPSFQGRAGHAPAFWPPDPRRGVGVAAAREPMPEGE